MLDTTGGKNPTPHTLPGRAHETKIRPLPQWRLRQVFDYVETNLGGPITLADFARVAGLSPMHFAAQFRAATARRPHEFLLERRIERAKAAMIGPRMPLVDIALSVGFQTQSHFTSVFKRLTGATPAQWRRSGLEDQL